MSQGEILISILLLVIAYMLYQIARQLSYLTGKRLKLNNPFATKRIKPFSKPKKHDEIPEKLPN